MYAVASSSFNNGGQAFYVQRVRSSDISLAREARYVGTAFLLLHALAPLSVVMPCPKSILQQPRSLRFSLSSSPHFFLLRLVQRLRSCVIPAFFFFRPYQTLRLHLSPLCRRTLLQIQVPPIHLLHREAAAMVYITSDLFGPVDTRQPHHHWHTMTDSQHDAASLGKRKRTQDGDAAQHTSRGSRPQHTSAFDSNNDRSYAPYTTVEHRPMKQIKRISPKLALVKSTSHVMDTDASLSPAVGCTNGQVQIHAITDLRACHACKSAPKRKKDLENYMDCKRCVGRTCYICARQCLGGCGRKVCRECTAEVGQERDSWCLDCLQRDQYMK